ncbi:EipB family protein [Bartonella sp. A05]|uniref:EipB family protein n=1 Tax=Bartonella sp. A05 TaxID=2967261 RepID=UPI0022A9545E|nr:DUF1849 family protein [Bartonella sp. A05]MCZ2204167.1 cell envelope integrity EipB family protein [Bartonella sp. A05]
MIKPLFIMGLYGALFCVAEAEESILVTPHRAVYDLQLGYAADETEILKISGRMVYELTGSACKGYVTRFRLVSRVYTENMPVRLMDRQIIHSEAGDGSAFRFSIAEKMGQDVLNDVAGIAERTENGITVKLEKPKIDVYKFAVADFPIMKLKNIIRQAKSHHRFYYSAIFDGIDMVKESVVIGEKKVQRFDNIKKFEKLDGESYWPVTISYFDDTKNTDGLPIRRISFLLYENGITHDLLFDYGSFSVRAKLNKLEFFDIEKNLDHCQ